MKFNLENVGKLELEVLPVCSGCKKVKINGEWYSKWENQEAYDYLMENYFYPPGKAKVTHGLCTECLKKHHSDLYP